ncbi:type IV pilus modification protein PilV [Pseudomonas oryzihabitans]|uniref:type IV pilus modification protein PilV n=1 Tax=Pseudomonas oryzihabitans TaxID=47885 RepID=UPI0011A3EE56|nr:type IV pilus modification protein PilV [Pseudomonas psychrotolerans]
MAKRSPNVRSRSADGFSMIEVLIALVVICIGVLGLAALQGKTLRYTNEAGNRNAAAMLAADLIEMMRSNRGQLIGSNGQLATDSSYFKAAGNDFPTTRTSSCRNTNGCTPSQLAEDQLAGWVQQVRRTLPIGDNDDLLKNQYVICATQNPTAATPCSQTGSAILIQLAWLGKDACPSGQTCPSLDADHREYYRISFQP